MILAFTDALANKYMGHFFTWNRYHIENYLLDEVAIYHVLAEDPDAHIDCSPSDVYQKHRSLADEHKDDFLAKETSSLMTSRRWGVQPGKPPCQPHRHFLH